MAQISTAGISSGSIIEPVHVLRSIDALNGSGSAYDIVISGSLNVSGTMRIATSSIVNVANQAVILAYNTSSGDIILCPMIINQEAKEFGLPSKLRWAHMIIHSMLHLQGYSHNIKSNRLKMEKLEVKLLAKMNYGNPYVRS